MKKITLLFLVTLLTISLVGCSLSDLVSGKKDTDSSEKSTTSGASVSGLTKGKRYSDEYFDMDFYGDWYETADEEDYIYFTDDHSALELNYISSISSLEKDDVDYESTKAIADFFQDAYDSNEELPKTKDYEIVKMNDYDVIHFHYSYTDVEVPADSIFYRLSMFVDREHNALVSFISYGYEEEFNDALPVLDTILESLELKMEYEAGAGADAEMSFFK